MLSPRSTLLRSIARFHQRRTMLVCWLLALLTALAAALPPPVTQAAPSLLLPTPPGERWRVIQGYACGTHNGWDRYSLDLAQVDGPTYGAPIRAAASGRIQYWESGSGTLILRHSDRLFTMYTHMARVVTGELDRYVEVGAIIGFAGDRQTVGTPHLHFSAFTANSDGWSGKQSIPLHFAEGYNLPEIGGCNQYGGTVVTASSIRPPTIHFRSEAQPAGWYNRDLRIEFMSEWAGGGLSQAWDKEPAANTPMFAQVVDGYAQLAAAGEGMHTLQVRVWGPDGKQSLATFGPLGYDKTPPSLPATIAELKASPGPVVVQWTPATDALSGMAGYRIYIGTDPEGKADWFTAEPNIKTNPLSAGRYVVRVQSLDQAGNVSAWGTLGSIVVGP